MKQSKRALVVEGDTALGPLCDYLHLNPVRARVVPGSRLADYWAHAHAPKGARGYFRAGRERG